MPWTIHKRTVRGILERAKMERIDRLIMKAQNRTTPRLTPWEKAMEKNPYVGLSKDILIDLLSEPKEDWRQIVQACAW